VFLHAKDLMLECLKLRNSFAPAHIGFKLFQKTCQ